MIALHTKFASFGLTILPGNVIPFLRGFKFLFHAFLITFSLVLLFPFQPEARTTKKNLIVLL
jgi:hypothetical protein